MMNECQSCHKADLKYEYTDYYDFDVYRCPFCGHEISMPADVYLDDESLAEMYGDEYFDDDFGDDDE